MTDKQVDLEGNEVKVLEIVEEREPSKFLATTTFKLKRNSKKLDKLLVKGHTNEVEQYVRLNLRPRKDAHIKDGDYDKSTQAIFEDLLNP